MLFIFSIITVLIFIYLFHKQIKKHSSMFYLGAVVLTIFIILYNKYGLFAYVPANIQKYVINIFSRATVSTALFTIVMYTGVLDKKKNITKNLYIIRGELAIIACILTFAHNISFGSANLSSVQPRILLAGKVSIIMIIIMILLMITSFKFCRKMIPFNKWKMIQRMSYLFYGLIYVHIICLYIPKIQQGIYLDVIIYSAVFITYYVLRIHKYFKDSKKRNLSER